MLRKPSAGDSILQWARAATDQINAQAVNGGPGIKVTRATGGTTVAADPKTVPLPDSLPRVVRDPAAQGSNEDSSEAYGTTYSVELSEQSALRLFGFSDLDAPTPAYSIEQQGSQLDFLIRDQGTEAHAIDGSPTLRYVNVKALLEDALEPGDDGEPPVDIGVVPDSEVVVNGVPAPVSKSIEHNSQNALSLYHFETVSAADRIAELDGDEDLILVRHKSGNGIPTLKYTSQFGGGGLSGSFAVVEDVVWDTSGSNPKLVKKYRTWTFTNGRLTAVSPDPAGVPAQPASSTDIVEYVPEQV